MRSKTAALQGRQVYYAIVVQGEDMPELDYAGDMLSPPDSEKVTLVFFTEEEFAEDYLHRYKSSNAHETRGCYRITLPPVRTLDTNKVNHLVAVPSLA